MNDSEAEVADMQPLQSTDVNPMAAAQNCHLLILLQTQMLVMVPVLAYAALLHLFFVTSLLSCWIRVWASTAAILAAIVVIVIICTVQVIFGWLKLAD